MDSLKVESLRKVLCDRRMELMKSSAFSLRKMISGSEAHDAAERKCEEDLPSICQFEVMFCQKFKTQLEMMKKIDRALSHFSEGKYGICEECGEEIGEARLSAIPFALCCRECQEERERKPRTRRN